MSSALTQQPDSEQPEPKHEISRHGHAAYLVDMHAVVTAQASSLLPVKGTHYKAHEISLALSL